MARGIGSNIKMAMMMMDQERIFFNIYQSSTSVQIESYKNQSSDDTLHGITKTGTSAAFTSFVE
jgi:hypothetical protein